jgi:rod shape determining protein RodA
VLGIDRRSIQNFDWVLFGLSAVLITCGIVNLMSASYAGDDALLSATVRRQLTALALGLVVIAVVVAIDYRHVERFAPAIYGGVVSLLVATLVLAPELRGARAWLFGGRFQPSELAKIAMVIAIARWFHRNPPSEITRLVQLWPPALLAGIPVGLILLQKDMGVAVLTLLVALTYVPLVRVRLTSWAGVAALGVVGLVALWSFGLKDYQQQRILDFIDPSRDPLSSGYQAMQSRIAVGSGGMLGKGWLDGTQTQLRFLPTQHTDFAYSVLAEEWGFVGSVFVLGTYLAMLLWGLWIARNSRDGFGAMLAVGLVGALFWPAVINVAMVLGLAPVIGVPLPLFSYGGSALVTTCLSLGLLLSISMRRYVF